MVEEYVVRYLRRQDGMAMFVAILILILSFSLGFLAFQVSTTELHIANYSADTLSVTSLAESGVEKALSWVRNPIQSPDESFFSKLKVYPPTPCAKTKDTPDYSVSAGSLKSQFSDLKEMGTMSDLHFYKSSHSRGICMAEATAQKENGAKVTVKVELVRPLKPISQGVVGTVTGTGTKSEECNPAPIDPQVPVEWADLSDFIKRYGSYYLVTQTGTLKKNGTDTGKKFDDIFNDSNKDYGLVMIDISSESKPSPISIAIGHYKGYFYFSRDINLSGADQVGKVVSSPNCAASTSPVNLDGFFYVKGDIDVNRSFSVYGAVVADNIKITGTNELKVWYNSDYKAANFTGPIAFPPLIPLRGTWQWQ